MAAGSDNTLAIPVTRWHGPNGHDLLSYEVDLSDGGGSRLRLRSPDGVEYWEEGLHLEIVEPERIVFTRRPSNGGLYSGALGRLTFRRPEWD